MFYQYFLTAPCKLLLLLNALLIKNSGLTSWSGIQSLAVRVHEMQALYTINGIRTEFGQLMEFNFFLDALILAGIFT